MNTEHTELGEPEFILLIRALRRAGLPLAAARRARDQGELKVFRIGGRDFVRWRDLLLWAESQRIQRAEQP